MSDDMQAQKGMVFGVFDSFHPGHEYFLQEARAQCQELVVVVTAPHIVEQIKKRVPKDSLEVRMQNIQTFDPMLTVVEGDHVLGTWGVLREHAPTMVYLGYDQQGIAGELEKLGVPYTYIGAHEPGKYKSSLM